MTEGAKTRVYVLGAGCSYDGDHGYPLATQFESALKAYGDSIAGVAECASIKEAADYTVKLLSSCTDASTIDQLINHILQHKCDDLLLSLKPHPANDIAELRMSAVRGAKIATAACFLAKEPSARKNQIEKYKRFIQTDLLGEGGPSTLCHTKLRNSTARVLSFNYDRLFELAFFAGFADQSLKNWGSYDVEVLNSALSDLGDVTDVRRDRFCFLKLHGTIGTLCVDGLFGEEITHVDRIDNWKPAKAVDEWFAPKGSPPVKIRRDPLIVFPYEKDYIVSGRDNKLAFRTYIKKVWDHARLMIEQASEIWVIGYSFDPTDCKHLVDALRGASVCERIVIQNLTDQCDRIEKLLKVKYRLNAPIEKYDVLF